MSLLLTLGLGSSGTPPTPPTGGDTPYMNLLLPTVSVTLGPLYATEVNQAFLRVDSHDHSDGYGHLVGTNGLNINADLSFHGFGATNLDSAGFNIRSHTSGLVGSVYMSGQDLYCVDGAGNTIQITAAGAVNVSGLGSWTGLTAPAQAGYSSVTKKFSLQSNTTGPVYGLLAVGDILLYPGDPNLGTLPYIRLATPNTGVTTYTMQLPPAVPSVVGSQKLMSLNHDGTISLGPTLPSVLSFMRMDSNGVPYADVSLSGTTLQLTGSGPYGLRVAPGGITTTEIANGAVTPTKLSIANAQSSTLFSTFTSATTPTTVGSVTTLSPTSGRPLQISLRASGGVGFLYQDSVAGTGQGGWVGVYLDSTLVSEHTFYLQVASVDLTAPASCVSCVVPASAASHTVTLKIKALSSTGGIITVDNVYMYVMEI